MSQYIYDGVLKKIEENTRGDTEQPNYDEVLDTIVGSIQDNTTAINNLIEILTPDGGESE